jgi:hypothetical protein
MDTEGWSLQSDSIDLSTAAVTITDDESGEGLPTVVRVLEPGFGAATAVSIIPRGWGARAGSTYRVGVVAQGAEFDYAVSFVDCSEYGDGTD